MKKIKFSPFSSSSSSLSFSLSSSLFLLLPTLTSIIFNSACTHSIHQTNFSEFSPSYQPYERGHLIKARGEQFTVMGFIFDTNYVNQAYNQLQRNCPQGHIQGIVTHAMTSHGFFSWTNAVEMQALCIETEKQRL
jgi:hypothetical protein